MTDDTTPLPWLDTGPADAPARLLLAHGAGGPMDSPFMTLLADLLAAECVAVTRFEFGYMAARRSGGKKRPPPRAEALTGEYRRMIEVTRGRHPEARFAIGGKSMGGRVASLVADELHLAGLVSGLVCVGYPFHPPGRPEELRTAHLQALACPTLIVQGERDPFGSRAEVEALPLSPHILWHWALDGDHDLGPRGGQGTTRRQNLTAASARIARFVAGLGASA